MGRGAGQERPRGTSADQQAHDQAEIVAGNVRQMAPAQIVPPAQPGPAHPAPVEHRREAVLDQLRPELERLLGHAPAQPGAVVVHGPTGLLVTTPAVDAGASLLRDPALPGSAFQVLQPVTRVVAFVGDQLARILRGRAASTAARLVAAASIVAGRVAVSPRPAGPRPRRSRRYPGRPRAQPRVVRHRLGGAEPQELRQGRLSEQHHPRPRSLPIPSQQPTVDASHRPCGSIGPASSGKLYYKLQRRRGSALSTRTLLV